MDNQTAPQKLARSKRFWSGIIGLVVIIVTAFVPELEENLNTIAPSVVGIVLTMIAGYSGQDIAREAKKYAWLPEPQPLTSLPDATQPDSE